MHPDYLKLLEYALYGGLAGLVGAMTKSRRLTLPQITTYREKDGSVHKVLDLGFLVAPLAGAVLAAIIDGRPQTALAYGLAAGYAGPAMISILSDAVLKRLGMIVGGLPETARTSTTSNGGTS